MDETPVVVDVTWLHLWWAERSGEPAVPPPPPAPDDATPEQIWDRMVEAARYDTVTATRLTRPVFDMNRLRRSVFVLMVGPPGPKEGT